jgi:pimeloyl-ACP methyl ester carboxylesterase
MSVTKVLLLFSTLSALAFSQTYVSVDFEQLAAPSGCIRSNAVASTTSFAVPALKVPGATISGGQALSYADPYQTSNNVYATISTCAGVQPTITITFDGPVSNLNMVIGDNWAYSETVQAVDDVGGSQNVSLLSSQVGGQTLFFANNNIRKVTLTLMSPGWIQSSPAGFYIDNISCDVSEPVYFFDPVPNLMSGTGVVADPESLATRGTLVKGVAADGLARVLLAVPTSHVGDTVTITVLNDRGWQSNSPQEDGGVTLIDGSMNGSGNGRSQSVRVAAQDTSSGPMAFALYYPPPDFSRGPQDDPLASRTVGIQVNSSAPNTPAVSRPLSILRPPVVLVHDLWGDPADWNTFTPLINDSRFFIRRASYNGVLGSYNGAPSRITASLPAFQSASIALAKENSLGLAYNAPLLLTEIAQFVNEFRATNNVAAAQADVVVHGMGGTLTRALVQLANYETPESFGQGNVNKLITIGTPHLGTPLATALLRNENTCFREVLADAGNFSFSTATVDGNTVSGGMGDIQGDGFGGGLSPALARIQQRGDDNASTALIAGIANNSNTSGLDKSLGVAQFIRRSCPGSPLASSLTSSGWSGVFWELSDAMVPQFSQLAGQLWGPSVTTFSGLVHSGGLEQLGFNPPGELDAGTPVTAAVINLLNTQVRSGAFQPLP